MKPAELEQEMLAVAEEHLASIRSDGANKLVIWAPGGDEQRQELLFRRGHTCGNWPEHRWRRELDEPIPDEPLTPVSLYRRDLDLVAVAPDGANVAFCTIWFDDVTRSAYYVPVATVPAHQRRGLGRALLTEGLRRLQRMGAATAFVGGYSPEANGLYRSVMGLEHELSEPLLREWSP